MIYIVVAHVFVPKPDMFLTTQTSSRPCNSVKCSLYFLPLKNPEFHCLFHESSTWDLIPSLWNATANCTHLCISKGHFNIILSSTCTCRKWPISSRISSLYISLREFRQPASRRRGLRSSGLLAAYVCSLPTFRDSHSFESSVVKQTKTPDP